MIHEITNPHRWMVFELIYPNGDHDASEFMHINDSLYIHKKNESKCSPISDCCHCIEFVLFDSHRWFSSSIEEVLSLTNRKVRWKAKACFWESVIDNSAFFHDRQRDQSRVGMDNHLLRNIWRRNKVEIYLNPILFYSERMKRIVVKLFHTIKKSNCFTAVCMLQ